MTCDVPKEEAQCDHNEHNSLEAETQIAKDTNANNKQTNEPVTSDYPITGQEDRVNEGRDSLRSLFIGIPR